MSDPDAIILVSKPVTCGIPSAKAGFSPSGMADLLAPGAAVPLTQSASRKWLPPSLEQLQAELPQYEITAFIAQGGMGAVYKGSQTALQRPVAIKVLPPENDDGDRQFAQRFKREAQSLALLSHPNIVAVFDASETATGLLYIVMEFIEGTDLAQVIASEGLVAPRRAVEIICAVCEALAFAHEEGIVHRDIKPSNIMIDRKGRVKVADFGLAKNAAQDGGDLTRSDMALGTLDFVAPEALVPGSKVDGRADLYAVGVMLYQMLTGNIPRGRFALPSGIVPQVNKGFDAIVDKAMQADPEKRYATATELETAVKIITQGAPPTIPSPSDANAPALNAVAALATAEASPKRRSLSQSLLFAAAIIALAFTGWWISQLPGPTKETPNPVAVTWIEYQPTQAELVKQGVAFRLADNGVVLMNGPGLNLPPGSSSRDGAIRATVAPVADADITLLKLRRFNKGGYVLCLRMPEKGLYIIRQTTDATGQPEWTTLKSWPVPAAAWKEGTLDLEFSIVGITLTAAVAGQVLGTVDDGHFQSGSMSLFSSKEATFSKIGYINLDGQPKANALKLAGIDQP